MGCMSSSLQPEGFSLCLLGAQAHPQGPGLSHKSWPFPQTGFTPTGVTQEAQEGQGHHSLLPATPRVANSRTWDKCPPNSPGSRAASAPAFSRAQRRPGYKYPSAVFAPDLRRKPHNIHRTPSVIRTARQGRAAAALWRGLSTPSPVYPWGSPSSSEKAQRKALSGAAVSPEDETRSPVLHAWSPLPSVWHYASHQSPSIPVQTNQ